MCYQMMNITQSRLAQPPRTSGRHLCLQRSSLPFCRSPPPLPMESLCVVFAILGLGDSVPVLGCISETAGTLASGSSREGDLSSQETQGCACRCPLETGVCTGAAMALMHRRWEACPALLCPALPGQADSGWVPPPACKPPPREPGRSADGAIWPLRASWSGLAPAPTVPCGVVTFQPNSR